MVGSDGVKPEISSYAIDHNKLPTVDQLDHWGRNLMVEYYQLADFQPPIKDKFLFAYCNATSVLTMVSSPIFTSNLQIT
jgi:hypothetical protein